MIYDAVGPGVELQLPVAVKSIPVKDWTSGSASEPSAPHMPLS